MDSFLFYLDNKNKVSSQLYSKEYRYLHSSPCSVLNNYLVGNLGTMSRYISFYGNEIDYLYEIYSGCQDRDFIKANNAFSKKDYKSAREHYETFKKGDDAMRAYFIRDSISHRKLKRHNPFVIEALSDIYFYGLEVPVDYKKVKEYSEYLCSEGYDKFSYNYKEKKQNACDRYKIVVDKGF